VCCRGPQAEAATDHTRAASLEQGSEAAQSRSASTEKGDPMKHEPKPTTNALFRHITRADDFVTWLRTEGDVLISSTDLLGGRIWATKAREIVATARKGGNLAAHRKTLIALRRLLHGHHAQFLDREEAWRFASLHPDSVEATRAMLCADALGRGIRAFEALHLAGVASISGGV